jgi:hypothetical protein
LLPLEWNPKGPLDLALRSNGHIIADCRGLASFQSR